MILLPEGYASQSNKNPELLTEQGLKRLVQCGLRGVGLIIADDHVSMEAARKAVFTGVFWQKYQFHLRQNASAYALK